MKKFLGVLGVLVLIFCIALIYSKQIGYNIPSLKIEEETVKVDSIHIYGTHLNIGGNLNLSENIDLVLYDGEFISYAINIVDGRFNLSEYLNDGIYLDSIDIGRYYMFLREKYIEEEKEKYRYYSLENSTEYKETVYYTMSNYDKKIYIETDEEYNTIMLDVNRSFDKNVYDIVIDPGHGGMDPGACRNKYCETDFTIDIATKVKEELEKDGIKVKLTHERGTLGKNEKLNEYGKHGRAVIPKEVNAKYVFSIHLNSGNNTNVGGLEVYTASNINYDFANNIVKNITELAGTQCSTNAKNKIFDGIYSRNFTEQDVNDSLKDYEKEKINAYDVSTNSNYYYMIRETGGIITGAYVDDRNEKIIGNPYVKTNVGVESYLLELGYLTNKNDLNNIVNNTDKYILGIVNSIKSIYNNSY